MENQLVRNKNSISSALGLMAKVKLIMSCEDVNYRISVGEASDHNRGLDNFSRQSPMSMMQQDCGERMIPKTNFFGETMEVPAGHFYQTKEDLV